MSRSYRSRHPMCTAIARSVPRWMPRARALIAIAAPVFQEGLEQAAHELHVLSLRSPPDSSICLPRPSWRPFSITHRHIGEAAGKLALRRKPAEERIRCVRVRDQRGIHRPWHTQRLRTRGQIPEIVAVWVIGSGCVVPNGRPARRATLEIIVEQCRGRRGCDICGDRAILDSMSAHTMAPIAPQSQLSHGSSQARHKTVTPGC